MHSACKLIAIAIARFLLVYVSLPLYTACVPATNNKQLLFRIRSLLLLYQIYTCVRRACAGAAESLHTYIIHNNMQYVNNIPLLYVCM